MTGNPDNHSGWQGKNLRVHIPFSRAGVANHVWVGGGGCSLLFDAGDGILRDLLGLGIPPEQLDAIFITHGHFDHMGGLHSLLGFMRMVDRQKALPIYLPEKCHEAMLACENFKKCYAGSISFEIQTVELPSRELINICDITVEPFAVVHCGSIAGGKMLAPIPAFGYRILRDNETIAISGDTGDCDSLRELVRDADLAIIEATYLSSVGRDTALLKNVHLSVDLATEIGRSANEFILVHKGKRG